MNELTPQITVTRESLDFALMIRNMCLLGPDSDPSYVSLEDGKWSVNGHIYPVVRPTRGPIRILPTREMK